MDAMRPRSVVRLRGCRSPRIEREADLPGKHAMCSLRPRARRLQLIAVEGPLARGASGVLQKFYKIAVDPNRKRSK
jgi:hypothetical protein